jgi:hypothetical protein
MSNELIKHPSFAFMDESGTVAKDPNQPFFAMGLILIENTAHFAQELEYLKRNTLASTGWKGKGFEFKFSALTRQYRPFYEKCIDIALSHVERVSVLILEKESGHNPTDMRFRRDWNVYLDHARQLVQSNVNSTNPSIIVADYFTKPHKSSKFLEMELRAVPGVVNAVMLESEACAFIQVADILTGCVVLQFRRRLYPDDVFDFEKCALSDYLALKLGIDNLAGEFSIQRPVCFEVNIRSR